ncbi:MAG: type II toxin-antitoxin system PemK/MazF family toxin [Deltaproteobacteria bacterium]|nr:type II toxin-antitoxin system PemK/MazF family toxin [Deltaproteobacteria bacterium]MBW2168424.1 type II toxin-antitoxin system PemK/MazF family toxin [Deltaproteobacteria bacterium]
MNRGDIWLIDLAGKTGMRPAVILTRQKVLEYLNKVSVAEVTTKGKGYPTEVFIGQKANLQKPSFIQTDNIHTVPEHRLVKYLGTIDPDTMKEVSKKVALALELESCLQ